MRVRQFLATARAPLAVAAALLVAGAAPPVAGAGAHRAAVRRTTVSDPAQYVNPFVGTKAGGPDFGTGGGAGNTFPGATAPLGMVQWSPDTVTYQHGGYFYDDQRIRGFSLTHISGAGCGDYGNIPFLPFLGDSPVPNETFSHSHERAAAGSYAVTFDNGLRTELTATQRSGSARFSYPAGQAASLLVDAGRAFNKASGSVTVGTDTISGYTDGGGFCGAGNHYRIYFTARFDQPFTKAGVVRDGGLDTSRRTATGQSEGIAPQPTWSGQAQRVPQGASAHPEARDDGSSAQAMVSFVPGSTVTARVGISFTSAEGAEANLDREQGGDTGFAQVRDRTRASWNELLGRIAVNGGTEQQRRTFYTALYHSLLHPSVLSDVNGQYPGMDGKVHQNPQGRVQYADFSGWDIYRSEIPLLALLAPKEASDIAESVLHQGTEAGYFDRWTLANGGTGVMIGDPMPMLAAEIHAFGGTDFDAADLLKRALAGREHDKERPGHAVYDAEGFLPVGTNGEWGPASGTLEYATADFALSQLAGRLGDQADHDVLLHDSANWRNIFNIDDHSIQPRIADHTWPAYNPASNDNFAEGSGAQYTWMVVHNQRGLFDAMGGNAAVTSRLDTFFEQLNAGPTSAYAFLGNEPSLNAPWAYDYAGRPDRTEDVVRRALTSLFSDSPNGEAGNDDLGEMGSWAVWSAIGLYPMVPGRAELALGSPLFPNITITRGNGTTIDISAPDASADARYVHGLRLNGRSSSRPWVGAELVDRGGSLDYDLATTPSTWGQDPKDAPPSFDVGPDQPVTGRITGLSGKCLDVDHGTGPAVQIYDCNGSGAQQWTAARDGSLQAAGQCLDVDHSNTAAGSVVQSWACNGTGAQQWWPRSDGSLFNPPSGRCLDVPHSHTDNGTKLQLWDCNGTDAQHWTMPNR